MSPAQGEVEGVEELAEVGRVGVGVAGVGEW